MPSPKARASEVLNQKLITYTLAQLPNGSFPAGTRNFTEKNYPSILSQNRMELVFQGAKNRRWEWPRMLRQCRSLQYNFDELVQCNWRSFDSGRSVFFYDYDKEISQTSPPHSTLQFTHQKLIQQIQYSLQPPYNWLFHPYYTTHLHPSGVVDTGCTTMIIPTSEALPRKRCIEYDNPRSNTWQQMRMEFHPRTGSI